MARTVGPAWLAATALLIAASGTTQDDRPDPKPDPRALEEFDANGDGKLDASERRRMRWRERFGRRGGDGRRGQGRGPGGPRATKTAVAERFDADGNGWLDRAERDKARAWVAENVRRRGPGGPGGRGPGGGGPGGREEVSDEPPIEPERLAPDGVTAYRDRGLYEPTVVRTLFLDFAHDDWADELTAFYRTDVEVPATLTIDGERFERVGVRFRGNSSFFTVAADRKRSLNVSVDFTHPGRGLHGHRTLNLLNAHTDPSFLRSFLFARVASDYVPALQANFVKVVINGKSHGIHVNVEQFNKDFLARAYGTRKGVRWKVPPNFGGDGGLRWLGEDLAPYRAAYALKTGSAGDDAWQRLVALCRMLHEASAEALERELPSILAVDEALWALAIDNVLMDADGYHSRASDYNLYLDPDGRFHVIAHDNNETFRLRADGPGGPRGRRRAPAGDAPEPDLAPDMTPRERLRARLRARGVGGSGGAGWSPLEHADTDERPLIRRLLAVPAWRARYLHHVKTIAERSLDWAWLEPIARDAHDRIADDVARDPRRLYSLAAFRTSLDGTSGGRTPSIEHFASRRRAFLLGHASLAGPWPTIERVAVDGGADGRVAFTARVDGERAIASVRLWVRATARAPFERVAMTRADGVWRAAVAHDRVRDYYVEAIDEGGRAAYAPRLADAAPSTLPE